MEFEGEEEFEILVDLEEDPIRNDELFGFRKEVAEAAANKKYRPTEQQLLQEGKLGDSEISARIKRAIFGTYDEKPACIILVRVDFCPKSSKGWFRFRSATVQVDFEDISSKDNDQNGEDAEDTSSGESDHSSLFLPRARNCPSVQKQAIRVNLSALFRR